MNEHSLIYMTKLYDEAMELNTKLQEELENLKNTNEEHRVLNGKLREENHRLNNIINDIDRYIHNWKLEDVGEKTMLILNDILLIKNGMSDEVIRLKGSDKE